MVSAHSPFSENLIFNEKYLDFGIVFGVIFEGIFVKNDTKTTPFQSVAVSFLASFSRAFSSIGFLMHFGRPLASLWPPFGTPWLPFDLI